MDEYITLYPRRVELKYPNNTDDNISPKTTWRKFGRLNYLRLGNNTLFDQILVVISKIAIGIEICIILRLSLALLY